MPYHIITDEECDALPQKFAHTALLAKKAGFDGVDIKCCHGYLLDEFLSAYSRSGKYGGSFENRTRLYYNCIDAVKNAVDEDMIVTTRLSAYDGFVYPYGFGSSETKNIDLTETKKILSELEKRNIELVNITIGNPYLIPHINRPYINSPEDGEIGVQRVIKITKELQKEFPKLKLILSALSYKGETAVDFAEKCLENGCCSLVGFGRMTLAYPNFYRDYIENGIVADYQDHHYPSEMSVDAMIQTYLMDDSADATDTFMKRFDKEWIRYNRDVVAKVKAYEEGNDHE